MANNNQDLYNLYENLKTPKNIDGYNLFRGTTDFTQLEQFNLYESGYPLLVLVSVPKFLREMAAKSTSVDNLLTQYKHVIEYEFKGFESGLENITSDTQEINNGVQGINVITKTNMPTTSTFSARYYEKSGSILTKMHQLYLRSVKDPATTYKTYNGIIGNGIDPEEAGFDKECFSFLYMHTDNTGLLLEQAVYIVGAMPTTAELSIYNGTKGEVNFQEVTCEFTGFPIIGSAVNARAKTILDWINSEKNNLQLHRNSWDYNYAGIKDADTGLAQASLTENTTIKEENV